jgi:multidrug resistance efflux pump
VSKLADMSQEGGSFEERLAETKISDAQAKLDAVIQSKSDVELVAPFDSQILSVSIAVGDQVNVRKVVATVADPTQLEIAVIPAPEELSDMGVGQSAIIRLSSQVGAEYPGRVRLLPDASSNDSSARLVLDDPAVSLTLNEAVTVIIQIDERADVLWLPPAALRSFQGRDFVLVNDGGVQRRVDVRLGLESDDRIEVVSGLEEGQVVVGP